MRLIAAIFAVVVALGCLHGQARALSLPPESFSLNERRVPPGESERKVIIVVADTATWAEYTSPSAPFMRRWLNECAVGLMNTRVQGSPTPAAAYLTLGAGSRAQAITDPGLAEFALGYGEGQRDTSVSHLFYARTGGRLPRGAIAYFGLPSVERENADAPYPLRLGLMGEALRRAGLKTAAVGNADLPDSYHRQIVTIVMDESGVVPTGDVGPGTYITTDSEPPFVTDYQALEMALQRALESASVVAIETGDLSRIIDRLELITPERMQQERLAAIARMDGFVARVVDLARGRPWRIYLVTPSLSVDSAARGEELAPIAAWGAGITRGVLTSPSTRRPGIIANMDLAPSILLFFDLAPPPEMIGRPTSVTGAPSGTPLDYVMETQRREQRAEANRGDVIKTVSGLIVAVYVIAAAVLILGGPTPQAVTSGLREAALCVLAFPLAMLVVPGGIAPNSALAVIAVLAATAALYGAAKLLGRWKPPYMWLTGAFAAVLCVDLVFGQHLVQRSLLSYSVTAGARYYGLGNELGGALLGALPLAVGGWLGARQVRGAKRLVAAAILACGVVIIAHPALGANFGIAVPAALGFGLMALALYSPQLKGRHVLVAVVAALFVALAIGGIDRLVSPQGRSHIGQFVAAVQRGGVGEMLAVFSRKAAMNWMLARHSIATWVLVSAVAVMAGTALGRARALSEEAPARSALSAALVGGGVASAAAFFLNDSGVLAAAWGLGLIAATLMYMVFDWRTRQGGA
jgi:hypothetical protein